MTMELELEDDVFFADISKQISLLIMDDDEQHPLSLCSSVSLQGLFGGYHPSTAMVTAVSPYVYEQSCGTRESKGTGVFIPRSSQPGRKHHHHHYHQKKHGRFSSLNSNPQSLNQRRQYHQQENTRTLSYNNNSTVHASNPGRT